jgi:cell division protein FtsB
MDKELITRYAPIVLIVFVMLFQYNLFVTPQELEIQHRQVLEEVSQKYMTKEESNNLKEQISDMQKKVDKIYDAIIGGKE